MHEGERPERIELAEEELAVAKREVERGRIVVRTRVEERDELAEIALRREDVTVERVPVGVPVDVAPAVREEDGVLIVPILEERLVIETRLILKRLCSVSRDRQPHCANDAGGFTVRATRAPPSPRLNILYTGAH